MKKTEQSLVFAINGEKFELFQVDPSTTLLEFLRLQTCFKSPKLGCGEGGCGACVVLLSEYDHVLDEVKDFTVSSCLTLLCSVHGCSITTAEGVGNSKNGFHPIQERFSGFHASQCGYCTPGRKKSSSIADKKTAKTEEEPSKSEPEPDVPSDPMTDALVHEEPPILPLVAKPPMVLDPIPKDQQRELFKLILEEKRKLKPNDPE